MLETNYSQKISVLTVSGTLTIIIGQFLWIFVGIKLHLKILCEIILFNKISNQPDVTQREISNYLFLQLGYSQLVQCHVFLVSFRQKRKV